MKSTLTPILAVIASLTPLYGQDTELRRTEQHRVKLASPPDLSRLAAGSRRGAVDTRTQHDREHARIEELRREIGALRMKSANLKQVLAREVSHRKEMEARISRMVKAHDENHEKQRAAGHSPSAEEQRRHDLEHARIAEMRREMRKIVSKSADLERELARVNARRSELQKQVDRLVKAHDENHERDEHADRRKASAVNEVEMRELRSAAAQRQHDREHREIDRARSEMRASSAKIAALRKALAGEVERHRELEEFVEELSKRHDANHEQEKAEKLRGETGRRGEAAREVEELEARAKELEKAVEDLLREAERLRRN